NQTDQNQNSDNSVNQYNDNAENEDVQNAAQDAANNQTDQNAQSNQNQNQNQSQQAHTVTGKENLYRIAIQYYGSGSPENVDKIRQANGISGNELSQGQNLVIP
ncbi:MAG: LysM peptidoglycan-binding domain-containing protein, partial [Mammaliicoccus vitulinus]